MIEDDVDFRQMLVQMLTGDGHEVAQAADGVEALQLRRRIAPDLIITDILMAPMDGVDTILDLVRQGSEIPIIAMSGGRRGLTVKFISRATRDAAMLGVAATLAKPFARAELRHAIEHALKAGQGSAPGTG